MSKLSNLAFWVLMMTLMACGGGKTEEVNPVGQLPSIGQPQPTRCFALRYHQTELGPANQTEVIPTDGGWLVATSAAKPDRYEPVQLHRFEGWSLSGDQSRSEINAGLGQFALAGDGTALLLSGYGHTEGERLKQVVEVLTTDTGKRLSKESWRPGSVAGDRSDGGYVYAGAHIRESGPWAQLGSVEPDGVQTRNFDTPLMGAQCAFSGGVVANIRGDIAAVMVMGVQESQVFQILFLTYSRLSGQWSRSILGSYVPELTNGECRPESVIRPLGIFADATEGWQVIWASGHDVNLSVIGARATKQRQVKLTLPSGAVALSVAQVSNGYLFALSGPPTGDRIGTIGAAFVRPSGEVAAYQPLIYGEMLVQPSTVQPYQAGTAALAVDATGRTAALAYVTKGGQAKVRFFSNDCR